MEILVCEVNYLKHVRFNTFDVLNSYVIIIRALQFMPSQLDFKRINIT